MAELAFLLILSRPVESLCRVVRQFTQFVCRVVPSRRIVILSCCSVKTPRGGDSYMEQTGMLVGNFEFNP